MIKIYFTSHHFNSSKTWVDSILRLTPQSKGIWKNITFTLDPKEADYYWIMDGEGENLPDMDKKAIYFGEHPNTPYSPGDKLFPNKKALLKLPLRDFLNPGELWLEYDYDYIMALKPKQAQRNVICVATYQTHHEMYAQRQVFLRALVQKYPNLDFDIYGRPVEKYASDAILKPYYKGCLGNNTYDATKGEHIVGKNIIENYKFTIEFDVGECVNYFSERFYDSLAVWCTPIYFGCTNMSKYLPHQNEAYYVFNQNDMLDIDYVNEILQQPKYYKEIGEVREILFNKYQMWAYCHHIVNNIADYKTDPIKAHEKWIKS